MPGTVLPVCLWRRIRGRSVGVFPTRPLSFQDEWMSDWYLWVLSSGKPVFEVEAVRCWHRHQSLPQPWRRVVANVLWLCSKFTDHCWHPGQWDAIPQFVPPQFFLPGLCPDEPWAEAGKSWWTAALALSLHAWVLRSVSAHDAMVIGLSSNQLRPLGDHPQLWTLSFAPSLFTLQCTEMLPQEHLMRQMKTKNKVGGGGLPLAWLLVKHKVGNQSPENCLYFFLFHSFVFHYFRNDWNDHYDHITIIMKEMLWDSDPLVLLRSHFAVWFSNSPRR